MQSISSARILGRIDALTGWLMAKYQLQLTKEVNDTKMLLLALSQKLSDNDARACMQLIIEYDKLEQQLSNENISDYELRLEKQTGARETNYIFPRHATDYDQYVLRQHDYIADMEMEQAKNKAKAKKIVTLIFSAVALIIIGVIVYNLPYFSEKRAYDEVQKAFNQDNDVWMALEEYKTKFPEGAHLSDVLFTEVQWRQNNDSPDLLLEATEAYIAKFPNGEHSSECKQIINAIWDGEIARYEAAAKDASRPAADYILTMLRYMKANNIRTINVDIRPVLNLKEYSEYPDNVREIMEYLQNDKGPKLPSAMITIKDKITTGKATGWGSYIVDALQVGFNRVLTPNFIKFVAIEEGEDTDEKAPKVDISYVVETQEFRPGFPDIWTYTQKNGSRILSESLLLGISMKFDAEFSIPGEKEKYNVSGSGNPGDEEISGKPETGYSVMCERCTLQFAKKIAETFGLKTDDDVEVATDDNL